MKKISGIYKITNQVNGKVYIGQSIDIHRRWNDERSRARNQETKEISAIYSAMNKYGIENFTFEIIEECAPEMLSIREQYWIDTLQTLSPQGYNLIASQPSAAKPNYCIDCGAIIHRNSVRCEECAHKAQRICNRPSAAQLYEDLMSLRSFVAVGRKYGVSDNAIRKWCVAYGMSTKSTDYRPKTKRKTIRKVAQIDILTGEIIHIWKNAKEAATFLNKQKGNHITEVCNGKAKTAYGYRWQFVDE